MLKQFFGSISTKVLIVVMAVVLPFNILALFLSNAILDAMLEQTYLSVKSIAENHAIDLKERMSVAQSYLYEVCYQDQGKEFLESSDSDRDYLLKKHSFYYNSVKQVSLIDGATGYYAYVEGAEDICTWLAFGTEENNTIQGLLSRQSLDAYDRTGWFLSQLGETPALLYSSVYNRNMRQNGSKYGGWINLEAIFEEIEAAVRYDSTHVFASEKPIKLFAEDLIGASVPVTEKIYLHVTVSRSEVLEGIEGYYAFMRIGTMVSLALIPVIFYIIYRMLLIPIKNLNRAQKNLQQGNLDYRITETANSTEFQYTYDSFNRMAEQIADLKIENYEKELEYQKMELNHLQMQIRPHFLLNTFNLIYTLSEKQEQSAVRRTIIYLSDYFRYLLRKGMELEMFDKEQHLIEEYMQVVVERYPGKVEIAYEYDPEIHLIRVPPLLLHNFVENVIKHAVRQGEVTHIGLVGTYENGEVIFQIMDDGPGIDPEKLKELNESMRQKSSDGTHVGYYNSMRRLKYFYGEKADITIAAALGEGTSVTVRFPYNLEELEYECFDRE